MSRQVVVTEAAEKDLLDIEAYIARHVSVARADAVLDRLERLILGLTDLPGRGRVPPELEGGGEGDVREAVQAPWRILYEVTDTAVVVLAVFDGRRNVAALLERRLTRGE